MQPRREVCDFPIVTDLLLVLQKYSAFAIIHYVGKVNSNSQRHAVV